MELRSQRGTSGRRVQPIMASNRRPAGQSDGSGNLSAIVAADRAFPAAVAELGLALRHTHVYESESEAILRPNWTALPDGVAGRDSDGNRRHGLFQQL